jgi:ATP-dependent protease ClpP protease subunit
MARDEPLPAIAAALASPRISLLGEVDEQMVDKFLGLLRELDGDEGDLAIEVTTLGGDAEMARRIVLEIEALRARRRGRIVFLGKTVVYSAGTTIMSAFPCTDRYLTSDTMLMIHCRQLQKTIELDGPMRGSLPKVEALCSQIKTGMAIEEENFRRLVDGCDVDFDTLIEKALYNWYLTAAEALKLRLVAAVVDIGALQRGWAQSGKAPGQAPRH